MLNREKLVVLNEPLVLTKEGKDDLVYPEGTLLKVIMVSNNHIVVEDDHQRSFLLKQHDENTTWSFM